MRLLSTLVVVSLVWSGCSKQTCLVVAGVGAGATVLMGVGAAYDHGDGGLGFGVAAFVSGWVTVGALINLAIDVARGDDDSSPSKPLDARELQAREARQRKESHDLALVLMKRATAAARAGDCGAVATLDDRVCSLDPELHDTVFMRDVAIARCMTAAPRTCTN